MSEHPRVVILALMLLSVAFMLACAYVGDRLKDRQLRTKHRGPRRLSTNVRRPASDAAALLRRAQH